MLRMILRWLWRLLILGLGVLVLWFMVFRFYPYADTRMPAYLAALLIYCFMAYGVIPFLIRIFRIGERPDRIPLYVLTPDGWPSDPVNIAVVGRDAGHICSAFTAAGWYEADPATFKNSIRELVSIIFNRPYRSAPFSRLYLFGRPFDIGFQKPSGPTASARSRHHVRFWRLEQVGTSHAHSGHVSFWFGRLRHFLGFEKEVWIGAALYDSGPLAIRLRNAQITHQNDTDTDTERDLIIDDLGSADYISRIEVIKAGEPFRFRGQTFGSTFICDGTLRVVSLKKR